MTDCGHLALIASGEGRGLCVLCQRAEIERLTTALADMLAWADTPPQEASPSWIIGACERDRRALKPKP